METTFNNKVANWAFELIRFFANQIIVVYFVKRTTGEMRRMVCTWDPSYLANDLRFDPTKKNLLQVWDTEMQAWRFISMDAVKKITVAGLEFDWSSSKAAQEDMHAAEIREWEMMQECAQDLPNPLYIMN